MNQFQSPELGGARPTESLLSYRDLEALAESPAAREAIDRDFGAATEGLDQGDGVSRRRWLQLMGASLALGAATGCRYPQETLAPFAFRPHNRIPGVPEEYATMIEFAGVARPIVATCYDGRPTKLDGNGLHDDNRGASDAFTQARILELYDPDRLREVQRRSAGGDWTASSWSAFAAALRPVFHQADLSRVAILAEPTSSPTLLSLRDQLAARGAKWYTFTSISDDNAREGMRAAMGRVVRPQYHFDKAKVIICLDADPLHFDPAAIRNNRRFAEGRDADHGAMSRLYCVESNVSITGACADHRMSLPSGKIESFLRALAARVAERKPGESVDRGSSYRRKLLDAMAQDLVDHAGAGVIIVGERQPPQVHAAAHRLNAKLGNLGTVVTFTPDPDEGRGGMLAGIAELASGMSAGRFETVVILGGNPAYDAPADVSFAGSLAKVPNKVHVTLYRNETSAVCDWVVNAAHPLEVWGDALAYDGSHCLAQPLILPLFGGKSEIEVLASLLGEQDVSGESLVKATAQSKWPVADFDRAWVTWIHDGFVSQSAAEPVDVAVQDAPIGEADESWLTPWKEGEGLEFVFTPSHSVYDGRFANSGWLQELPDFITKMTWDNAALVNPETARALGLRQDMLYSFQVDGHDLRLPVHIQPGQARGSIAVAIGYGRTAAGRVGGDAAQGVSSVGHSIAMLRTTKSWFSTNTGKVFVNSRTYYPLSVVQENWQIDSMGRGEIQSRMFMDARGNRSALLREGTFDSYQEFLREHPIEHHGPAHDEHHDQGSVGQLPHGALPIISPQVSAAGVSLVSLVSPKESADDKHAAQWPAGFHQHHEIVDLTPGVRMEYTKHDHQRRNMWGMSIDLNKCTGCNACVVACQSENNIPIVGKADVRRGREMHWLRIDRYFGDNLYNREAAESDDKQIIHQPVTCHHCENAPCETVCPVAATTHSSEGLNDMVYNRCIGTRYCGNNCPFKVRRFNYFNYTDAVTFLKYPGADKLSPGDRAIQHMMMNPEVTIRSRGVMEKCTFCVQRIQNGKIKAKVEHRELGANEIRVACQQACPTQAIEFGDLNHPESRVHAAHHNPRAYYMLEELNIVPRTKYLARVRNPHPALVDHDDRKPKHG